MKQNELICIMPVWKCDGTAAIIPNISEEDESLVMPNGIHCCYVTILNICWSAKRRNPFLPTQKGEKRGISLCTHCPSSLDHPEMYLHILKHYPYQRMEAETQKSGEDSIPNAL